MTTPEERPSRLDPEEYVEQAYFFRALSERLRHNVPAQEAMLALEQEVLSTTRLPLAIQFLAGELKLKGVFGPAMARLPHYFSPFQTFLIFEAEKEGGRFDFRTALEVLERESTYRATRPHPQGVFLFQFEALCRNRLGYDRGLEAMSADPEYSPAWVTWILQIRHQLGLVDLADLMYVRSEHYQANRVRQGLGPDERALPSLFGEKEGKIALAHRRKDPLWLFATLERQLGYPVVPRPPAREEATEVLPQMLRRLDRLEARVRLLDEEQRTGIDLSKFVGPAPPDDLLEE